MPSELLENWDRITWELRRTLPEATYDIWVAPLRPVAQIGSTLTLEAPNEVRGWVCERFAGVLRRAAEDVIGPGTDVDIVGPGAGRAAAGGAAGGAGRWAGGSPIHAPASSDLDLNPKLTFEQFVIGDANRLAHAAALAVAEMPGQAYNPLFIYGPPGVGKTHLLHSIGNYVRTYGGGMTVRCATAEQFTNEFVAALQSGRIDAFKGGYRRSDVLLIDDVQFLQAKARTEEEFFHTFNALYDTGSQLVLTCDRLPRDMDALEERLRERFEAGLVADVRPPDFATRLTILRKRAQHDGVQPAGEGVLETIADRVTTNIRALEGALIRVIAYSSLTGRPLTAQLAEEVLERICPTAQRRRRPSVIQIQEAVCAAFGLSRTDLLSTSRSARLTWPRHVAMYLAREHTDETLPAIGEQFGGRHHSTVLHALRQTADRMACDPEAFEIVRSLTERLVAADDDRRD